nr:MAG TPA_asm: hypothetical protein [Caudoviricetes sp.]
MTILIKIALYIWAFCTIAIVISIWYNKQHKEVTA